MFFGNSAPTIFTLLLTVSMRKGEDPVRVLKELNAEFYRHLVLPAKSLMCSLLKGIHRTIFRDGKRHCSCLSQYGQRSNVQPTDFELLAAYPVDRPNPPVAQRLRFLKSRQNLLHEKLQPGTVQLRSGSSEWFMPINVVTFETETYSRQSERGDERRMEPGPPVVAEQAGIYACRNSGAVLAEKK